MKTLLIKQKGFNPFRLHHELSYVSDVMSSLYKEVHSSKHVQSLALPHIKCFLVGFVDDLFLHAPMSL